MGTPPTDNLRRARDLSLATSARICAMAKLADAQRRGDTRAIHAAEADVRAKTHHLMRLERA